MKIQCFFQGVTQIQPTSHSQNRKILRDGCQDLVCNLIDPETF